MELETAEQVARRALSLDETDELPRRVLRAIRRVVARNPRDTNFRIETGQGDGYGIAYCLESKCHKQNKHWVLEPDDDVKDGGLADGFGSLRLFTHHQEASPAHAKSMKERLKSAREAAKVSSTPTTRVGNKALPSQSSVPAKRSASQVITLDDSDDDGPPKKTKQPSLSGGRKTSASHDGQPPSSQVSNDDEDRENQMTFSSKAPNSGKPDVKKPRFPLDQAPNNRPKTSLSSENSIDINEEGAQKPFEKKRVNPDLPRRPLSPVRQRSRADSDANRDHSVSSDDPPRSASQSSAKLHAQSQDHPKPIGRFPSSQPLAKPPSPLFDSQSSKENETGDMEVDETFAVPRSPRMPVAGQAVHPNPTVADDTSVPAATDENQAHQPIADMRGENERTIPAPSNLEDVHDLPKTRDALRSSVRALEETNRVARLENRLRGVPVGSDVLERQKRIDDLRTQIDNIDARMQMSKIAGEARRDRPQGSAAKAVPEVDEFEPRIPGQFPGDVAAGPGRAPAFTPAEPFRPPNPVEQPHAPVAGPSRTGHMESSLGAWNPDVADDSDEDAAPIMSGNVGNLPETVGFGEASIMADDDDDLGPADEHIAKFFDQNKDDFAEDVTVEQGLQELGMDSLKDCVPGSNIVLYAHQVLGVAWMLSQETKTRWKGGILADEMGLGKTVQTISLLLMNQSKDKREKTTLIIAPLALLEQWKDEIESKSKGRLSCLVHHGTNKTKSARELQQYDVVLTTTGCITTDWVADDELAKKQARTALKKKRQKAGQTEWTEDDNLEFLDDWMKKRKQTGPIFTSFWYRVVIDEGQNIRNRETKISRAVAGLSAKYRWILSGTPVVNTLTDLYAYMRFLKAKPWQDWNVFRDRIHAYERKNPALAGQRAQIIMRQISLRRKKDSKLNGKPLITLPEKHIEIERLKFTSAEREVYQMVEQKAQARMNKFLREDSVAKNYHLILIMMLRLRQICGHAALLAQDSMKAAFEDPQHEQKRKERILEEAVKRLGEDGVAYLKKRRLETAQSIMSQQIKAKELRGETDEDGDDIQPEVEECPSCLEPFDQEMKITKCGHYLCATCVQLVFGQAKGNDDERGEDGDGNKLKDGEIPCPNCRQAIHVDDCFELKAFEPTNNEVRIALGLDPIDDTDDEDVDDIAHAAVDLIENTMRSPKKKKKTTSVIQIDDDDDSDFDELASPPPARTKPVSKATKRRVIESDDEGSDDSFIDDSGVALSERVQGYKGKGKGRAESLDSATEDSDEGIEALPSSRGDVPTFAAAKGKQRASSLDDHGFKGFGRSSKASSGNFIPSTKLSAAVKTIQEAPKEDKFLVISQWTSLLDLAYAYFKEVGIPSLRFQGDMKKVERDKAVKQLNQSGKHKCMLMSLKAGGVGLNLTGANRVIMLDLAWNPASEGQAMDRTHRLGQKKEVYVKRSVIENTIEDRLLMIQDKKQMLADAALGEGKGVKLKRMSTKEMKMLFGMTANPIAPTQ